MGRAGRLRFALVVASLGLAALGPSRLHAGELELEQAVKATYLVKFAPFVTWPPVASARSLKICVQGKDPFGDVLDRAVAGQVFRGKPVAVVRLDRIEGGSECDIAWLSGSAVQSAADAALAVRAAPTLTVTDGDQTHAPSAILLLRRVDGRERFSVDLGLAHRAGLEINSKLLALAVSVKR